MNREVAPRARIGAGAIGVLLATDAVAMVGGHEGKGRADRLSYGTRAPVAVLEADTRGSFPVVRTDGVRWAIEGASRRGGPFACAAGVAQLIAALASRTVGGRHALVAKIRAIAGQVEPIADQPPCAGARIARRMANTVGQARRPRRAIGTRGADLADMPSHDVRAAQALGAIGAAEAGVAPDVPGRAAVQAILSRDVVDVAKEIWRLASAAVVTAGPAGRPRIAEKASLTIGIA